MEIYKITDQQEITDKDQPDSNRNFRFTVEFDPSHPVYNGHFPGNPVTPGVCQVQMIRELASAATGRKLKLKSADNIKFLAMLVPVAGIRQEVVIGMKESEPGSWSVSGTIQGNGLIYLKFKGIMQEDTAC